MQSVLVLAALLGLVAFGHALECYQCKGKSSDIGHGGILNAAKPCAEFDKPDSNKDDFKIACPDTHKTSCLKVTLADDDKYRGCANVDKEVEKCEELNTPCYCKDNKCNGSSRGWPSAMLLLAALTAALVGSRR